MSLATHWQPPSEAASIWPGFNTFVALADALGRLRRQLPEGGSLPASDWRRRHAGLVALLWLHVVGLAIFGMLLGNAPLHSLADASAVAVGAVLASLPSRGRRVRAIAATVGLLTASAVLVHLSGGYVEMHFHFFVVLGLVALYEDWAPFLVAIGYVVVEHGLGGMLLPAAVYNHP